MLSDTMSYKIPIKKAVTLLGFNAYESKWKVLRNLVTKEQPNKIKQFTKIHNYLKDKPDLYCEFKEEAHSQDTVPAFTKDLMQKLNIESINTINKVRPMVCGSLEEENFRDLYLSSGKYQYNETVSTDILIGKIDAMSDTKIYEFKYKRDKLYTSVLPCDYVQVQLYLHASGIEEAELVSYKDGFYRYATIRRNDKLLTEAIPYLSQLSKLISQAKDDPDLLARILDQDISLVAKDIACSTTKGLVPSIRYSKELFLDKIYDSFFYYQERSDTLPITIRGLFDEKDNIHHKGDEILFKHNGRIVLGVIATSTRRSMDLAYHDEANTILTLKYPFNILNISRLKRLDISDIPEPFGSILSQHSSAYHTMYLDIESDGSSNIVQIAYILYDPVLNKKALKSLYIRNKPLVQDYFRKIPLYLLEAGLSLPEALDIFLADLHSCRTVIAHNISYDLSMLYRNCLRTRKLMLYPNTICTMYLMKDHMKLLNKRGGLKNPKLSELQAYLNVSISASNEHDAQYDVVVLFECVERLIDLGFLYQDLF